MEASDRTMSVVGSIGAVLRHDLAEARDEDRQALRINSRILYKGDGLGVSLDAHEQSKARFSQLPDRLLFISVIGDMSGVAEPPPGPESLEGLNFAFHFGGVISGVFDAENHDRVSLNEAHALGQLKIGSGQVEDHLV